MNRNVKSPSILSQADWDEIYDAVALAQDALGSGPEDVDESYLINNIMHLRTALTIAHKRAGKLGVIRW